MDHFFSLFADSLMAWNQVGLLTIGIVLLMIGCLCFAYLIYRHKTSYVTRGRIIGVRATTKHMHTDPSATVRPDPETDPERESDDPETLAEVFKSSPGATALGVFFALLVVGLPLVFVGIGGWHTFTYYDVRTTGIQTEAEILRYHEDYNSESGTSYHAVVYFRDKSGRKYEAQDRMTGRVGRVGDIVNIYYDPDDPSRIIIGGFKHNMILPLAFMGVGGLFLFMMFTGLPFLQARAARKRNKQSGAYTSSEMYCPVYEYQTSAGERQEVRSLNGSNWLVNKLPGKTVRLLVNRDDPENADRPMIKTLIVTGGVFVIAGLILSYQAFANFETTPVSMLFIIGVFCYLAWKARGSIRKIPLTKGEFAAMTREKRRKKAAEGRLLTKAEIRRRVKQQDRQAGYWVPVLTLIAVGLIVGGAYAGKDMKVFLTAATQAEGTVVQLESRYSSSGNQSYTYYPVVSFQAADDRPYKFRSTTGANPPAYKTGEGVTVYYNPDNPYDAIIDRGLLNWLLSAGLILAGCLLLFWALSTAAGIRARRSRL